MHKPQKANRKTPAKIKVQRQLYVANSMILGKIVPHTSGKLTCFKAYDIRGKLGEELNEDIAYRIGRAFGQHLSPKTVVLGGDVRESSEALKLSLALGLQDAGVNVLDIGMVGTEEIYFATAHLKLDGGIVVTASHNPIDYNGMKLVREQSRPISGDSGLFDIQALAESNQFSIVLPEERGVYRKTDIQQAYVDHLLSYINVYDLKPMKVVVNAGNGAAGHVIDAIESLFNDKKIPIRFIKVHHQPDATFPNGIPNPLLPENRADTANAVIKHQAHLGIAWDGDFDRCFLFDENGEFIEGYYIVGLLAEAFLQQQQQQKQQQPEQASPDKIIHDPRLIWNTQDIVQQNNGQAIMSKTGHAFIKERMREEDAIYGGEMSAHHYFKRFNYCDSGMIPWLLVIELLSNKNQPLSELVKERIRAYPSSGEINSTLAEPKNSINKVSAYYLKSACHIDHTDGLSMSFNEPQGQWRFNLRSSNTEPVVRLNVESINNVKLMQQKTAEILEILRS